MLAMRIIILTVNMLETSDVAVHDYLSGTAGQLGNAIDI